MLLDVDESEVMRAAQRLSDDRLALAEARRALKHQCRRTLTRPSTVALLLLVGGLAGARSKTRAPAPEMHRASSVFGALLRPVWPPLLKGVTALAVERAMRAMQRWHDQTAPVPPPGDQAGESAA